MNLVRLVRDGVLSGLVGTTAMTLATAAERSLRPRGILIDYDASEHVVTATAAVLRVHPSTRAQKRALFLLTHWGYGSAVAVAHETLVARWPERISAPGFYLGAQTMAFTLFPTIGETPLPWKWAPDVLATSLAQHAVYTAAVATTSEALRKRRRRADRLTAA